MLSLDYHKVYGYIVKNINWNFFCLTLMGSTPILTWDCSWGFKTVITINANDVVTYARNFFFMTPVSPRSLTLVSFSVLRACSNLVLRSMISWSASSSICLLISSCSNPCSLCDSWSWELSKIVRLSLQIRGGG